MLVLSLLALAKSLVVARRAVHSLADAETSAVVDVVGWVITTPSAAALSRFLSLFPRANSSGLYIALLFANPHALPASIACYTLLVPPEPPPLCGPSTCASPSFNITELSRFSPLVHPSKRRRMSGNFRPDLLAFTGLS